MEKRKIGKTGLEVTTLSFGSASLGNMPDTYGYKVSEQQAWQTVRAVFESPVNMLDSSRNYGFGRSEERIGAVIRERGGLPEGFVISTKLDRDMPTGRFDAAQARKSLEESLKALSLDRIPILHLHDPEHSADLEEIRGRGGALDELFKMKEEGFAQAVGLAMGRLDMMMPLLKDWPFDVLISHNRYMLLNRSADEMFSWAYEAGIAIINAAPFAGGILAKGSAETNRIAYQVTDDSGLAPVRAIEALCNRHKVAAGAAALQFSMRDPRIATTLVGVSSPHSIEQNLQWASAEIPAAFWAELKNLPYSMEDPEANRLYRPG